MKNLQLRLPDHTLAELRAAGERAHLPATTVAREAIEAWLRQQSQQARHVAIAAYAVKMAHTDFDLEPHLESAGIEHLVKTIKM